MRPAIDIFGESAREVPKTERRETCILFDTEYLPFALCAEYLDKRADPGELMRVTWVWHGDPHQACHADSWC